MTLLSALTDTYEIPGWFVALGPFLGCLIGVVFHVELTATRRPPQHRRRARRPRRPAPTQGLTLPPAPPAPDHDPTWIWDPDWKPQR